MDAVERAVQAAQPGWTLKEFKDEILDGITLRHALAPLPVSRFSAGTSDAPKTWVEALDGLDPHASYVVGYGGV